MKNAEYYARILTMILFIVLGTFYGWNWFMPVLGFTKINVVQALGLLLIIYIPNLIISSTWKVKSDAGQIHYHYDVNTHNSKKNDSI